MPLFPFIVWRQSPPVRQPQISHPHVSLTACHKSCNVFWSGDKQTLGRFPSFPVIPYPLSGLNSLRPVRCLTLERGSCRRVTALTSQKPKIMRLTFCELPHCAFGDIIHGKLNKVNMLFFCSISVCLRRESSASLYK